jgi:hypothetical protein
MTKLLAVTDAGLGELRARIVEAALRRRGIRSAALGRLIRERVAQGIPIEAVYDEFSRREDELRSRGLLERLLSFFGLSWRSE